MCYYYDGARATDQRIVLNNVRYTTARSTNIGLIIYIYIGTYTKYTHTHIQTDSKYVFAVRCAAMRWGMMRYDDEELGGWCVLS